MHFLAKSLRSLSEKCPAIRYLYFVKRARGDSFKLLRNQCDIKTPFTGK